jgi:hypothetical protein
MQASVTKASCQQGNQDVTIELRYKQCLHTTRLVVLFPQISFFISILLQQTRRRVFVVWSVRALATKAVSKARQGKARQGKATQSTLNCDLNNACTLHACLVVFFPQISFSFRPCG